jgi:Family of unknown function (DUF6263)
MSYRPSFRPLSLWTPVVAIAVALSLQLAAQEPLRYRWTKGEARRYRIVQDTMSQMSAPGIGDMTVSNSISQVHLLTPTAVGDDGQVTLEAKIESMKMSIDSQMMSVRYDSAEAAPTDPVGAEIAKGLAPMIGATLTVVLGPDGTAKNVTGAAKILEKMQPALGAAASALGTGLDSLISDASIAGSYNQGFLLLPSKPVREGDTWTVTFKMPNPLGDQTITKVFTLRGTETVDGRSLTKMTFTATTKVAAGASLGPMTIQVSDASGDGEVLFDRALGLVRRAVMRQTMPMTMNMTGPDGTPMSIANTVKSTSTLELVEK